MCARLGITLERLERFQPILVHILLYVCVIILCMYYIYLSPKHQFPKGIWMIHFVEEIKLLLLLGNRMVMTSRLATVGQTYPRKHIVSAKM
jgi:ABC-type cobalamin transport system permease subunit